MDKIQFSKIGALEASKKFSNNNVLKTKPYGFDSFEKTGKNKATTASFKGLGAFAKFAKSDDKNAPKEIRKQGIKYFEDGIAYNKKNKEFSGKIEKETADGAKYEINFENGKMTQSIKRDETKTPVDEKTYRYDDAGKLKSVHLYKFKTDNIPKAPENLKGFRKSIFEDQVRSPIFLKKSKIQKTIFDDDTIKFYSEDAKVNELKRRANISDEEFSEKVHSLAEECFEEKGLDKNLLPKIKIKDGAEKHGGAYLAAEHSFEINPVAYKNGNFELEDVIMHEMTHCEQSLLRARLREDIKEQVVKDELTRKLFEGDNSKVFVGGGLFGPRVMIPPKMSEKMKKEFAEIAENSLYKKEILNKDEFKTLAKNLLKDNPDFIFSYNSESEALENLAEYMESHNIRYVIFTSEEDAYKNLDLPELSQDELKEAKKSLINFIDTVDGNAANQGMNGIFGFNFEQYYFSPEEVLAKQQGESFAIEKMKSELEELKSAGKLTAVAEANREGAIAKLKLENDYITKNIELKKLEAAIEKNPENKEEFEELHKKLECEISEIKEQMVDLNTMAISKVVHKEK